MSGGEFTFEMEHLEGYEFKVKFDAESMPDIVMDEPPPLGRRNGPNASRMLAAAVANCLSASLMFCVTKADAPPRSMRTSVTGRIGRNEKGRLRVEGFNVRITVSDEIKNAAKLKRCLILFEDFCVVTASVKQGIQVDVEVVDGNGESLLEGST